MSVLKTPYFHRQPLLSKKRLISHYPNLLSVGVYIIASKGATTLKPACLFYSSTKLYVMRGGYAGGYGLSV